MACVCTGASADLVGRLLQPPFERLQLDALTKSVYASKESSLQTVEEFRKSDLSLLCVLTFIHQLRVYHAMGTLCLKLWFKRHRL